jgi:membrane-bound metal-dependent hydrolase YbcI (DUF457 family)
MGLAAGGGNDVVMGPTHATTGALAWLAGAGAVTTLTGYPQSPAELAVYTVVCTGSALLPDLDVAGRVFRNRGGATAAKVFGVVSLFAAECVEKLSLAVYRLTRTPQDRRRRNGHRTLTHTLAFAILLGALVSGLVASFGRPVVLVVLFLTAGLAIRGLMAEWVARNGWLITTLAAGAATVIAYQGLPADGYPLLGVAVGLGCAVHLAGDMITHHGCPLLWPLRIQGQRWYMVTTPPALSVRAGGGFERAVLLPGLTAAVLVAAAWQVPALHEVIAAITGSFDRSTPEAGRWSP